MKFYGTRTARPLWLLWHRTLTLKFWAAEFSVEKVSLPRNGSERNSDSLLLYFFPRNGIPSCFLFRWRIRKAIPRVRFYFRSTERHSELFSFCGRVRNGIPRFPVPRNNRNSVGNNHLFRLFRLPRNYFFVGNSQPYRQPSRPWDGTENTSPCTWACNPTWVPKNIQYLNTWEVGQVENADFPQGVQRRGSQLRRKILFLGLSRDLLL